MKRYLFFHRSLNDIDNITPAIYYLLCSEDDICADLLIYTDDYDYRRDINLAFLSDQFGERITVTWLGELLGLSPKWNYGNPWTHRALKYYGRLFPARSVSHVRAGHRLDQAVVDRVLTPWIKRDGKPYLAVFDQNRSPMVRGLVGALRRNGIKHVVSLPVSPFSNVTTLRSRDMTTLTPEHLAVKHDYSIFDRVGVVDRFYLDSLKRTYKLMGKKSPLLDLAEPLGSIRYCPEWLEIRRQERLYPSADSLSGQDNRPKIVFFLSNPATNAFWDEVLRTLTFLCEFPQYQVIVKPHTRHAISQLPVSGNVTVDHKTPSSTLIDASDIILFWGTSVALEGYMKGKFMACLDYVNGNLSIYRKFETGYVMQSRDDLHALLACYINAPETLPYNQAGIEAMLHEVVYAGQDGSVPSRYLAYLKQYASP